MLVVLDANIIVADSLMGGTVWRVLAHAVGDWGVRIVVPRVALAEADAVIGRKAEEATSGLQNRAEALRRLGLPVPEDLVSSVAEAAQALKQHLADRLDELGVEIVEPPDVDHMTLVERAVSRIKPCDDKGDGYRDTLIWLTIVDLARQTDEPIAFVSHNTHDFGDLSAKNDLPLHPHLVKELAAADAADQVTLFHKLDDLVMALATKNSPTAPTDLSEVGRELERAKAVDHITTQVVAALAGQAISPSRCGLPRYVASASIEECGDPEDIEIIATHPKGADSLARFSFRASVTIAAEVVAAADVNGEATERTTEEITKTLRFSGVLTRDQFERPTSAEVTEISALPGDPGLAAWASRGYGAWLSQTGAAAASSSAIQAILDAQKFAGAAAITPTWMKTIADIQKTAGGLDPPWMKTAAAIQKIAGGLDPPWMKTAAAIQKIIESQHKPLLDAPPPWLGSAAAQGAASPSDESKDADNEGRDEAETDSTERDGDEDKG